MENFQYRGLVCVRINDEANVNVPHKHKHHSPTGLEWGYGGSGPADLALNVLALMMPCFGDDIEANAVKLADGSTVSREAWALHQQFKWDFLATMPHEGGMIPIDSIRAWCAVQVAGLEQ